MQSTTHCFARTGWSRGLLSAWEEELAKKERRAKPRPLNGLAESTSPYVVSVRASLLDVYLGRNSTDVRARTARNEMAHSVAAHHLAHWRELEQQGRLEFTDDAGRTLIDTFFEDVFGVPLTASQSALQAAGRRSDGKLAYEEWLKKGIPPGFRFAFRSPFPPPR